MQKQNKQFNTTIFFVVLVITYLWPVTLFSVTSLIHSTTFLNYVFTIIGSLVILVIALFAIRNDTVNLKNMGWSQDGLKQAVKILSIGWIIWAILIIGFNFIMGNSFRKNFETPLPKIIVHWLFVGVAEEMLFRGYILTKLMQFFAKIGKVWSKVAGIVVSSLIFATYHIPQLIFVHGMTFTPEALIKQLFPLFLSGLLLAWIFLRSKNVLFVGLFHGGMNAPLIGYKGNLVPVFLFVILEEIFVWKNQKKTNMSSSDNLSKLSKV